MEEVRKTLQEVEVRTEVVNRSAMGGSERDVPDLLLHWEMLLDGFTCKPLRTVLLLMGDGAGWTYGKDFCPH